MFTKEQFSGKMSFEYESNFVNRTNEDAILEQVMKESLKEFEELSSVFEDCYNDNDNDNIIMNADTQRTILESFKKKGSDRESERIQREIANHYDRFPPPRPQPSNPRRKCDMALCENPSIVLEPMPCNEHSFCSECVPLCLLLVDNSIYKSCPLCKVSERDLPGVFPLENFEKIGVGYISNGEIIRCDGDGQGGYPKTLTPALIKKIKSEMQGFDYDEISSTTISTSLLKKKTTVKKKKSSPLPTKSKKRKNDDTDDEDDDEDTEEIPLVVPPKKSPKETKKKAKKERPIANYPELLCEENKKTLKEIFTFIQKKSNEKKWFIIKEIAHKDEVLSRLDEMFTDIGKLLDYSELKKCLLSRKRLNGDIYSYQFQCL